MLKHLNVRIIEIHTTEESLGINIFVDFKVPEKY